MDEVESVVKSKLSAFLIMIMFETIINKGKPQDQIDAALKEAIERESLKFIENLSNAGYSVVKTEPIPEAFKNM